MANDPEIAAIDKAMADQGKKRADLGRLLGLDSSQVTRLFKGERRLQRQEYTKVMAWLGLAGGAATEGRGGALVPLPGMVPLYGWVGASSESRLTTADQNLRGFVPMHPNQAHIRDAFALEVADISMIPRYEPGEIVYLAPNRWPKSNQDCVVVTQSAHGYLKRFVRRDDAAIYLQQLNPQQELQFSIEDVSAVHTVVGRG